MNSIWDVRAKYVPFAIAALLFAFLEGANPAATQQGHGPSDQIGRITGHVFCADTGGPARFARVTVQHTIAIGRNEVGRSRVQEDAISTRTDMDGRFALSAIPPGTYFVLAWLKGYESPLSRFTIVDLEQDKQMTVMVNAVEDLLPHVTVEAGETSSIDIALERGAEISGTVSYDDGAPVVGAQIGVLRQKTENQEWLPVVMGNSFAAELSCETDDRGHYRLSGLPAGRYLISAKLPTKTFNGLGVFTGSVRDVGNASLAGNLEVFSGNSIRKKNAAPITISKDEHRAGLDLTISISKLHRVSGVVVAQKDEHPMRAGIMEVLYADDLSLVQRAYLTESGQFLFNFLPSGEYVIKVIGATDDEAEGQDGVSRHIASKSQPSSKYQATELHIDVQGDVDNVVLSLREIAASQ